MSTEHWFKNESQFLYLIKNKIECMDILSSLIDAVTGFISAVVSALLVVGVAVVWGLIIAGVVGVIVLLILKARQRAKKEK